MTDNKKNYRTRRIATFAVVAVLASAGIASSFWFEKKLTSTEKENYGICGVRKYKLEDIKNPPPVFAEKDLLSVEETLGNVFLVGFEGKPANLDSHSNPAARPYLYKLIKTDLNHRYVWNLWLIMGYIGEKPDVEYIDKYINSLKKKDILIGTEASSMYSMFMSLGIMSARKVEGSKELLDKYSDVNYWADVKFELTPKSVPNRRSVQYELISKVMYGYSMTVHMNVEKKYKKIRDNFKNHSDHELVEGMFSKEAAQNWHRTGVQTRGGEREPVSASMRGMLAGRFNGDLENPGPADPKIRHEKAMQAANEELRLQEERIVKQREQATAELTAELTTGQIKTLHEKAQSEYVRIKGLLLNKKYANLLDSLLDNKHRIDATAQNGNMLAEFQREAEQTRKLAEAISNLKTEPVNFKVVREFAVPYGQKEKVEIITVTYELKGSNVYVKANPKQFYGLDKTMLSKNRDLVVYMKRINNKWHWNPFSW